MRWCCRSVGRSLYLFHVPRCNFSASARTMAPTPIPLPRHVCDALGLDAHEVAFREGSATIVLPTKEAAFLNPVQEFNRDLSVLALRAWSDQRNAEKRKKYEDTLAKRRARNRKREAKAALVNAKRIRTEDGEAGLRAQNGDEASKNVNGVVAEVDHHDEAEAGPSEKAADERDHYHDYKFTVLEALSATGLRSIRYAREVPLLRNVLANDLSTTAVAAMKRNVALNFPAGKPIQAWEPASDDDERKVDEDAIADIENGMNASAAAATVETSSSSNTNTLGTTPPSIHPQCRISINEGDAMSVMYAHREERKRFDVVDLDPYGSASMFLDGAVQSVSDGGMLCVTCTDTAVLAGTSHPEKCYSAYGGVTTKTEYSHEFALRLLLHAIATSAGRYGRHVEPLLSLSIDFYVRVFVRVHTRPVEVKRLAAKTGAVFTCTNCQLFSTLPFGRHQMNVTRTGQTLDKFQPGLGANVEPTCSECGSRFHTAGPMWLGPLHDPTFCRSMLAIVAREPQRFKTHARIQGMVGTAAEELNGVEAPFFFTPSRVSSFFHSSSPPLLSVVSALLHAGHRVSRSHCQPGSLKTTASRADVYDAWRAYVQRNPVKMDTISLSSPAHRMLTKPLSGTTEWNWQDEHPDAKAIIQGSDSAKGTRYQINPLPNWGPGTAARTTRAAVPAAATAK